MEVWLLVVCVVLGRFRFGWLVLVVCLLFCCLFFCSMRIGFFMVSFFFEKWRCCYCFLWWL